MNMCIDEQTVVLPYNVILFTNKERTSYQGTKRHRGTWNAYCYMKQASLKFYLLYDYDDKTFCKRWHYKDVNRQWFPEDQIGQDGWIGE